jgi:hypothetical protein
MASARIRMTDEPIRPAATVVLWRESSDGPQVLMGQRGEGAVFMPSKFVMPPRDQASLRPTASAACR